MLQPIATFFEDRTQLQETLLSFSLNVNPDGLAFTLFAEYGTARALFW
jgi:hypothetical protein